ncbi:MAG: divalent-cation tolerance protein CutA [Rickettsiales bacterium]|nr:divalent-cation tolerance protein CutA [Rickettsiales bacterium]
MKFFYVTCRDKNEAKQIAFALLEQKLVFCANIIPFVDSYFYEGDKITSSEESVLVLKTETQNAKKVEQEIVNLHSYDVPAIVNFDCHANFEFASIVAKVVA